MPLLLHLWSEGRRTGPTPSRGLKSTPSPAAMSSSMELEDSDHEELVFGELPFECRLKLSLPDERQAEILFRTMSVDPEVRRDKVKRTFELQGSALHV